MKSVVLCVAIILQHSLLFIGMTRAFTTSLTTTTTTKTTFTTSCCSAYNTLIYHAPRMTQQQGGLAASSAAAGAESDETGSGGSSSSAGGESDEVVAEGKRGINTKPPTTFREAEVLGLRYMQEGKYQDALKTFKDGMKLPGSRPDVIRTKTLSGPSPVGGSQGGMEGRNVMTLDEFEMQAAYYNIACAYAKLGDVKESVANLKNAFDCGFDNYATARGDPDLSTTHGTPDFDNLMNQYEPKQGFANPFSSIFGGNK